LLTEVLDETSVSSEYLSLRKAQFEHRDKETGMARQSNSRQARWERATADARAAVDRVTEATADAVSAFEDLSGIKDEYQDWLDNLPDGLRSSPVGEKLEAVTGLDLDISETSTPDEMSAAVEEAEGADLPLGWGKD
jgi:hypothetical protein